MSGGYVPSNPASVRGGGLPHNYDCLASRIDQCVECWNDWSRRSQRTDAENYIHGDIKFALEYVERRWLNPTELLNSAGRLPPEYTLAEPAVVNIEGKFGDKLSDHAARKVYIVCRWDKQFVFVENIHFIDEGEKLVPSRFTMRVKLSESAVETCPGAMGQNLLDSTIKPVCFFGERELHQFALEIVGTVGGNDIPIGVVESGAEIVNNVSGYQSRIVYDGFVLFGKNGAFTGFGIGFDDQSERSRFSEKFVKLSDVLRGPINLEKCAICHGKPGPNERP